MCFDTESCTSVFVVDVFILRLLYFNIDIATVSCCGVTAWTAGGGVMGLIQTDSVRTVP